MIEPRWLRADIVIAIHGDLVREHGGALGLRDEGLLESALERPRNHFQYGNISDVVLLAAAYGFGLARNHPFVDGNKRIAFQAMYVFLNLHGVEIIASEEEVVATILALAAGDLSEEALGLWLREHSSDESLED